MDTNYRKALQDRIIYFTDKRYGRPKDYARIPSNSKVALGRLKYHHLETLKKEKEDDYLYE